MPTIRDIIQKIQIEGDNSVTSVFQRIQNAGTSAFSAIENAVSKLGGKFAQFQADLDKTHGAAQQFKSGISQVGSSIGTFVTRVTGAGAVVSALGAHLLSGVLGISTAMRGIRESSIASQLAIRQEAQARKQDVIQTFEQQNAIDDLRRSYLQGNMSVEMWVFQQRELIRVQERANMQARLLHIEQEDLRKQQAHDVAQQQKRLIQIQLEAQYGGALASTLVILSNILEQVRQKFLAAFGPTISEFLLNVGNAINNNSNTLIGYFKTVADAITASFKNSKTTIDDVVKGVVKFAADATRIIVTVIVPAFQFLIGVLNNVLGFINGIFGTNFTASAFIAAAIIFKFSGLFGQMAAGIKIATTAITVLLGAFGVWGTLAKVVALLIITVLIPALAKIDWASFGAKALEVWNSITKAVSDAAGFIQERWAAVTAFLDDKIRSIIGFFKDLIAVVKEFLGLTGASTSAGTLTRENIGDVPLGLAEGGLFRGRPGKDTNLAMLTDLEYVMNPKAVKHWGVGFMNAVNSLVNPFRGFNAGGLVSPMMAPAPIARFAAGGLNRTPQGRPFILQIGDQEFDGMTAQDETADQMIKYANRRGVRSAGRRPVWFGGGK